MPETEPIRNENGNETQVKDKPIAKLQMTRAQVLEQSVRETNLLIILHENVYNLTKWQYLHPGGHLTLRALCGKDATEAFEGMHQKSMYENYVLKKMRPYATVLEVEEEEKEEDLKRKDENVTIAFRRLTNQMHDAGLFQTRYSYFVFVAARILLTFCGVLYSVLHIEELSEASQLSSAVLSGIIGLMLGFVWQQAAFIGHDLGHNGISHNRTIDSCLGLFFGNFFTGFSIAWWKRSHNVHHIVTNSIEHDPDIQHLPVFAITPKFLQGKIFSTWFGHDLPLSNAAHVIVKYQHLMFYPVMAFARFNLYVQSLLHAMRIGVYGKEEREFIWKERIQLWTLVGFHIWMTALTIQLPDKLCMALFYILAHNFAGILHIQITLSHFCMPTYSGVTYDNDENGYVRTQLRTSLDIDCPAWFDWFHGGLQFQTVHHLWPRVPRHNLRQAQEILKSFCKEHNLEYKRMGFISANKFVIKRLKETAKSTKNFHEIFSDAFNFIG